MVTFVNHLSGQHNITRRHGHRYYFGSAPLSPFTRSFITFNYVIFPSFCRAHKTTKWNVLFMSLFLTLFIRTFMNDKYFCFFFFSKEKRTSTVLSLLYRSIQSFTYAFRVLSSRVFILWFHSLINRYKINS